MNLNVAVILVLYKKDVKVEQKVKSLCEIASKVVVVDNTPSKLYCSVNYGCACYIWNGNRGGLAGAYNIALHNLRKYGGEDFTMFLDDDTNLDEVEQSLSKFKSLDSSFRDCVGFGSQFIDQNTNLYGGYMSYKNGQFVNLERPLRQDSEVSFIINSMSIWRTEFLESVGFFCEELAVDHIDTDICLAAKSKGLRVMVMHDVVFRHEIGRRRSYKLFGHTFQSGGHGVLRRFLIGKNSALLMKRYGGFIRGVNRLLIYRIGYEILGILIVEDEKFAKVKSLLLGVIRGLAAKS